VAGYREFQTGEVLTAANVNQFLMEQAVMTFADGTARDAALSGVLREGLLVYNLATSELQKYDGSAWVSAAPAPPAGIGSNVVTNFLDTIVTLSGTVAAVSGFTVSITPTSTSSKILLLAMIHHAQDDTGGRIMNFRFTRNGTAIAIPPAAGLRRLMTAANIQAISNSQGNIFMGFLDSPSTTSAVTYGFEAGTTGGAGFINRTESDADSGFTTRTVSTLTAIEVSG